jgi:hypothetical protein
MGYSFLRLRAERARRSFKLLHPLLVGEEGEDRQKGVHMLGQQRVRRPAVSMRLEGFHSLPQLTP